MENLPIEIQWNIFKFMRHPVADAFRNARANIADPPKTEFYYNYTGYSFAFIWFDEKIYEIYFESGDSGKEVSYTPSSPKCIWIGQLLVVV